MKIFLHLSLLCSCLVGSSQSRSILDSLKQELESSPDSIKQTILLDLAWEYSFSNIDSSEYYCLEGIRLAESRKDKNASANSKSMLAIVYDLRGDIEESAALYLEVAKFYESENNLAELSKTYNNLGVLFFYNDQYDKSYEYYKRSMDIDVSLGDSVGVGESLVNFAATANKWGEYEKALRYLRRGKAIVNQFPENTWLRSGIYDALASNFLYQEQYDSSLFYYKEILPYLESTGDVTGVLSCLNGLISISIALEDYDEAKEYLNYAESLTNEYDDLIRRRKRNQLAATLYAQLRDYEKAFNYQLKYQADYDSITTQERIRITNELEEKYQAEQRENEITNLKLEQQNSKNQRNIILLISAFILGVSILLFVLYRVKSRSEATIAKSLEEKETLLKEIHHRVKNNLQVVSSLLSMQSRFIKDEQALGAVNEGQSRVESMALIHQKLYQENNLSGVNVREYIEELSEVLKQSYSTNSEVDFEYDIDDLTIDVDTIIPIGLILNELICNSLKHAFPDDIEGTVSIKLKEQNDKLHLEVSDNGVGTKSPSSEKSFGLVLIESLALKLKATLQTNSESGTSTSLTISKYKLV